MKNQAMKLASVVVCFFAFACTEVSFPTHQPKGIAPLAAFPLALQGRYTTSEADSLQDTLSIEKVGYHFSSSKGATTSDWLTNAQLSDSLVVKEYKGYYFVNFKEKDQWLLRVAKVGKTKKLTIQSFAIDGPRKEKLFSELNQELPIEVIKLNDTDKYYRIDPSPKKLLDLIKTKKYWEETTMSKIKN